MHMHAHIVQVRDRAVVIDKEKQQKGQSNRHFVLILIIPCPSHLVFNKTDDQPAILAGTVQLLLTRRVEEKTMILPISTS